MGKVLVIGCGGVASVAIHKCCQNSDVFTEVCIASRTKSKCDALKEKLEGTTKTKITTRQVDADKVEELIALSKEVNAKDTTKTDEVAAVSGSAEAAAGRDVITIPAKK